MTPTRYPGWRILGLVLGFGNLLGIALTVHLVLNGDDTSLQSIGWVSKGTTPSDPTFLTLVFCMSLTVIGALISIKRPAFGFMLLGASYLASVLSVLVLFPFEIRILASCGFSVGLGILYTWLGAQQRTAARS